ncbi:unnamed protein product, partial [Closterium sp. Naga37s-1]
MLRQLPSPNTCPPAHHATMPHAMPPCPRPHGVLQSYMRGAGGGVVRGAPGMHALLHWRRGGAGRAGAGRAGAGRADAGRAGAGMERRGKGEARERRGAGKGGRGKGVVRGGARRVPRVARTPPPPPARAPSPRCPPWRAPRGESFPRVVAHGPDAEQRTTHPRALVRSALATLRRGTGRESERGEREGGESGTRGEGRGERRRGGVTTDKARYGDLLESGGTAGGACNKGACREHAESPWAATLLARQASYYSLTLDEFQATFAGASHQRRLAPSGSPRSRRCSPPRKPLGAQIRVRVTGLLCAFSLRRQNSSAAITRVAGSAGSAGRGFTGVAGGAGGSNGSAGSDGTRPSSGGIAMGVGMGVGMGGGVGGGVGMGGGMVPTAYGVGAGMGAGMVAGMGAGADLVLRCAGPSSQNRTAPFWKLPSAPRWAPCLSGVFLLSPLPHLHCAPHTLHHRSPALPVTCPLRYRHCAYLPDAVKKLARRLLFDKSANDNHERSILTKLKQQCGGHFTSKMEGMVTDLTLAPEQQAAFEEYLADNPGHSPGIDLTVTVLTTVFWPSYKSSDLALPAEMVRCVEVFKEFYQTKTKHRKLTCIYSQGTCNITGKFTAKPIELIVTTYLAAVLLLFNASERLTDEDIVRLLHSLSCAKYKILVKKPAGKTIEQSDVFAFNPSFTDKMRRIK